MSNSNARRALVSWMSPVVLVGAVLCLECRVSPSGSRDGGGDDASDADEHDSDSQPPPECDGYPCGPYGTAIGDVWADTTFVAANDEARELAGADGILQLRDIYQQNIHHGGDLTGLMIFSSTEGCGACDLYARLFGELYPEVREQGILILGMMQMGETGSPTDPALVDAYADRWGWTFPAVAGQLEPGCWPAGELLSFPVQFFVDLRTMKIYGRFSGVGAFMTLIRDTLAELARGPVWAADGGREVDFDCAPGVGTETEPNGMADTLEDGRELPFALSGALCPSLIVDGITLEQDVVDLGQLTAGTVLEARLSRGAGSPLYPFFALHRADDDWWGPGPSRLSVDETSRQYLIDQDGRYALAIRDGRTEHSNYYIRNNGTTDDGEECCRGGPDHTYQLDVTTSELAATDPALSMGENTGVSDGAHLNVHPFAVTAGTTYTLRMFPDDERLDPYLVLLDPETATILAVNDNGNEEAYWPEYLNSLITWSAAAAGTIWVVAGAAEFWSRSESVGYRITIE